MFLIQRQHGLMMADNGFAFDPTNVHECLESLFKITTEVCELGKLYEHTEADNFTELDMVMEADECADIFLRLAHYCYVRNIDLGTAVIAKFKKNANRPFKHGKLI